MRHAELRYSPKLERVSRGSLVLLSLFRRESGGAIVMIAHVSAARGHGLLFHSPTHTSTHMHLRTRILSYTLFQSISFLHKDTHAHTHTGLKP